MTNIADRIRDLADELESEDEKIDAADVRDKLYDFVADAETLAGHINYLLHADLGEVRDRIHEAVADADQLAQNLRDYHSEL